MVDSEGMGPVSRAAVVLARRGRGQAAALLLDVLRVRETERFATEGSWMVYGFALGVAPEKTALFTPEVCAEIASAIREVDAYSGEVEVWTEPVVEVDGDWLNRFKTCSDMVARCYGGEPGGEDAALTNPTPSPALGSEAHPTLPKIPHPRLRAT